MMPRFGKSPRYWGGYILGALIVLMIALRIQGNFEGGPNTTMACMLLGIFSGIFLLEFLFSGWIRWPWGVYFIIQSGCLLLFSGMRPFLDVVTSAYLPLFVQAFYYLPRRRAAAWSFYFSFLLVATLAWGLGPAEGIAQGMMIIAEAIILTTFVMLVIQSQTDREQSQALLLDLQQAHQKLQDYTLQAEQLVAARERYQLARELHDSVGQMIFSIELTCESARLLLERDPAAVPELLVRLQEMTGSALSRLRSIISELRPHTENSG